MTPTEILSISLIVSLVVVIVLVFISFRSALRRGSKEGWTPKSIIRAMLPIAILFIAYLTLNITRISPVDWVQMFLTAGLVIATVFYAFSASRQAAANVKMAEEMREQRYDSVRPVMDFKERESTLVFGAKPSYWWSCELRNIGLGPAIDVYSFVVLQPLGREKRRRDFGTIPKDGNVLAENLSIEYPNGRRALVAYYRDVYGRLFESSRYVNIDIDKSEEGVNVKLGPLEVRQIKEDELP
jgi:hypothetical protein